MGMGMTTTSTSVTITGDVSAGLPQANSTQTEVRYQGTTTNGTATVWTESASTKTYITGVDFTCKSASVVTNFILKIAGTQVLGEWQVGRGGTIPTHATATFPTPLVVDNNETCQVTGVDTDGSYTITGYRV